MVPGVHGGQVAALEEGSHCLLLAGKPRATGLQGTAGCRRHPDFTTVGPIHTYDILM